MTERDALYNVLLQADIKTLVNMSETNMLAKAFEKDVQNYFGVVDDSGVKVCIRRGLWEGMLSK